MKLKELIDQLTNIAADYGDDVECFVTEYGEAQGRGMPVVLYEPLEHVYAGNYGQGTEQSFKVVLS